MPHFRRRLPYQIVAEMSLVTLDFHNTLFQCDEWFQLEIEFLPVAFLRWRNGSGCPKGDGDLKPEARRVYREIRSTVMSSGQECDAVTSLRLVLDYLNVSVSDSEIDAGVREIMQAAFTTASPIDGAFELVQRLHAQNLKLVVVSSAAYHPFLEWCLSHHGMRDAFSEVVTSAACGIYKSDPKIYGRTLERHQTLPSEAVHIGDSHRFDVTSAHKAGMHTILYSPEPATELDPAPDAVIQSLADAPPHVGRFLNG